MPAEFSPMDGGEGHFAARLRKKSTAYKTDSIILKKNKNDKMLENAFKFYDQIFIGRPFGERLEIVNNKIIILPEYYNFNTNGLNVLRAGVILGEILKNRIEPHHSAFAAAKPEECTSVAD